MQWKPNMLFVFRVYILYIFVILSLYLVFCILHLYFLIFIFDVLWKTTPETLHREKYWWWPRGADGREMAWSILCIFPNPGNSEIKYRALLVYSTHNTSWERVQPGFPLQVSDFHPLQVFYSFSSYFNSGAASSTIRITEAQLPSRTKTLQITKNRYLHVGNYLTTISRIWLYFKIEPRKVERIFSLKGPVPLIGDTAVPVLVQDEVEELHPAEIGEYLI